VPVERGLGEGGGDSFTEEKKNAPAPSKPEGRQKEKRASPYTAKKKRKKAKKVRTLGNPGSNNTGRKKKRLTISELGEWVGGVVPFFNKKKGDVDKKQVRETQERQHLSKERDGSPNSKGGERAPCFFERRNLGGREKRPRLI